MAFTPWLRPPPVARVPRCTSGVARPLARRPSTRRVPAVDACGALNLQFRQRGLRPPFFLTTAAFLHDPRSFRRHGAPDGVGCLRVRPQLAGAQPPRTLGRFLFGRLGRAQPVRRGGAGAVARSRHRRCGLAHAAAAGAGLHRHRRPAVRYRPDRNARRGLDQCALPAGAAAGAAGGRRLGARAAGAVRRLFVHRGAGRRHGFAADPAAAVAAPRPWGAVLAVRSRAAGALSRQPGAAQPVVQPAVPGRAGLRLAGTGAGACRAGWPGAGRRCWRWAWR